MNVCGFIIQNGDKYYRFIKLGPFVCLFNAEDEL